MSDSRSERSSSDAADEAEAIEASSAEIAAAIKAGRRSRRSSREDIDWVRFDGYHEPSDATRSSMLAQSRLQGSLGLLQKPEPADLTSVIVCARYIQALYRRMQWRQHLRATRLEAHLDYKVNNKERFLQLQDARIVTVVPASTPQLQRVQIYRQHFVAPLHRGEQIVFVPAVNYNFAHVLPLQSAKI